VYYAYTNTDRPTRLCVICLSLPSSLPLFTFLHKLSQLTPRPAPTRRHSARPSPGTLSLQKPSPRQTLPRVVLMACASATSGISSGTSLLTDPGSRGPAFGLLPVSPTARCSPWFDTRLVDRASLPAAPCALAERTTPRVADNVLNKTNSAHKTLRRAFSLPHSQPSPYSA
jgi:hypothetical protein